MVSAAIEDPVEFIQGDQLPAGNPQGIFIHEVVKLSVDVQLPDGSVLFAGSAVVVREISPLPTVYLATVEIMRKQPGEGTTGQSFSIQLPLLAHEDPPEFLIRGGSSVAYASATIEQQARFKAAIKSAMRLDPDTIIMGKIAE